MKKKLTERELAKQVIKELENKDACSSGICIILARITPDVFWEDYLETYLPKLSKHLSKRRNMQYDGLTFVGRKMGVKRGCYLWKPHTTAPRIKILKQVYKIK